MYFLLFQQIVRLDHLHSDLDHIGIRLFSISTKHLSIAHTTRSTIQTSFLNFRWEIRFTPFIACCVHISTNSFLWFHRCSKLSHSPHRSVIMRINCWILSIQTENTLWAVFSENRVLTTFTRICSSFRVTWQRSVLSITLQGRMICNRKMGFPLRVGLAVKTIMSWWNFFHSLLR